jgi:HK97 family phage major capsid protein
MSYAQRLIEQRAALIEKSEALIEAATTENRNLTAEEDQQIADALKQARDLDESIKHHSELEDRAAQAKELRAAAGIEQAVGGARVVSEARTYTERGESSFIRDAYNAQFNNDYSAKERLARHMNEERIERRDVTSTNFAGLVVPQFLTELAAPFARAGRPFLDRARKHNLPPDGLTISISKVTTGSATAVQTEGATVQETNMDDTKLDVSVVTVAGQQNVSRQAIERGTNIDSLVMADLVSAYHTNLDSLFVTTSATSLTNVITQVITYTDASPTVAELYPKLLDGVQRIQTNFFGGPNFILMHPRRLAFILAAVDTTNRPLAVPTPNGPMNAVATGNSSVVYGNSGYSIAGLPVITDANVTTTNGAGTNEDVIIIGNTQEAHLWEDGAGEPMMLRFDQPKSQELDITMIVYGYSAFTANRYPNAFALIGGTGLVTPTF